MRTLPAACTILAAAASAAHASSRYRNIAWGKKLSYFAGSCSPEGEAPRGENNTYVWGLLLFVVAFNFVCFDLTRDAAAAADDELRAAVADALLPESDDEDVPGTTLASLETLYQEEYTLPSTASKMTRLADRCEWNAWNMATITGEYDPDHTTIPRWRAQGRVALIRETAARLGVDEAEVRRRVARRGWMGEAFERDVELSELGPPDDGYRTPPRVHYPIP